MEHFIINYDHPGTYYAMFYLLAFLVGFIMLLWEGRCRQFPVIPWMMLIATAFLFFMAGCRMVTFSAAEWSYVWRLESIPYGTARSILGGILFGIPGILLAKKFLGFKQDMMDAFAFVLPAALVVERFGCLMAGCCYGMPANLPWSIQYGPGSFAFTDQVKEGLLSANSLHSLPVHPVQVYEVICALVIIGLLIRLRKNINASGNFFFISTGMYGAFRFLLEFVRASHGESSFIFNRVQWLLLIILPLLFMYILVRERSCSMKLPKASPAKQTFIRPAVYLIFLALLFVLVARWLGALEIVSLNIVLLPMLGVLSWYLFKYITFPRFRMATLLLPLGSLILMSQTIADRPLSVGKKLSYYTFSGGMMSGTTKLNDINTFVQSGGYTNPGSCYGSGYSQTVTTTTNSANQYSTGALGISHTGVLDHYRNFTYGVNIFSGSHTETFNQSIVFSSGSDTQYANANNSYAYYGIKPYIQHNEKGFGFGLGLSIGQMRQLYQDSPSNMNKNNSWSDLPSTQYSQLVPAFSLRLGNLSKFFLDYGYCNQFTPTFPVLTHQVAFGFPLDKNGSLIRMGSGTYAKFFIASSIRAGNNFIVEPFVGLGLQSNSQGLIGSINLHYKFGRKEKAIN